MIQSIITLLNFAVKIRKNLSVNPTKWSNTLKIICLNNSNCLNVCDHFVILALKGLRYWERNKRGNKSLLNLDLLLRKY